mmetsp:Transcript_45218/g.98545  ORF Transcript_45218/g.98545 Transcript_45218/m.98545 type:complete len:215 (-) Transcript_45218:80-724(-)
MRPSTSACCNANIERPSPSPSSVWSNREAAVSRRKVTLACKDWTSACKLTNAEPMCSPRASTFAVAACVPSCILCNRCTLPARSEIRVCTTSARLLAASASEAHSRARDWSCSSTALRLAPKLDTLVLRPSRLDTLPFKLSKLAWARTVPTSDSTKRASKASDRALAASVSALRADASPRCNSSNWPRRLSRERRNSLLARISARNSLAARSSS